MRAGFPGAADLFRFDINSLDALHFLGFVLQWYFVGTVSVFNSVVIK